MVEYVASEPKTLKPGEPIEFTNKCKLSFSVGTGIMFEAEGEYHVIVKGNRVTVQGYYPPDVRPVVHGRWTWDEHGMDWGIGAWLCSECGVRPETWWATEATINPLRCSGSHYCGHCGARMDGDGE